MSRGCLISLREQDFTSVGGHPLLRESPLVDSEEAAATKTSVLHGYSIPPATADPRGGDTKTAFKVLGV